MQIDIRRACARSQGGDAGQRPFLNVPLPVIPLLPSNNAVPFLKPPSSLPSSTASSSPSPTLSALSEPCSSTSFIVTGVACGLCSDCIRRARYGSSSASYAMRTPPDTPPRSTLKSIPAPTRARNFTFLPLLEASTPPPSIPPPPTARAPPRWNACLDSDVDQSSDEEVVNDGWPSDWPGSRRSPRRTAPSFGTPPTQKTSASQAELSPATPPSPPAEANRPGLSYFAPVTFKANISAKGSPGSSPTKALTSPTPLSNGRSPTRAVSPKVPPLMTTPFDLYSPNSPPSPPSPGQESALLDLRKCSLEANTDRPKPKQFKFVPLA